MFQPANPSDPPACPSWDLLLRHVVQPEGLSHKQCEQIVEHLAQCQCCSGIYEELSEANEGLLDEAVRAAGLPKRELRFTHSAEEDLADLWRRIEAEKVPQTRDGRRRTVLLRSGKFAAAVAACAAIVVVGSWLLNGWSQPVAPVVPQGYAERIAGGKPQPLALGQPVATQDQRQEILLGGMHRVVMNADTTAAFDTDSRGDYQIRLSQGELYIEVVPGHIFEVTTPQAKLTITGTKFNVKTDRKQTELALLKGSVRFASLANEQSVDVTAGHASLIAGRSAPTLPKQVDAQFMTAWARLELPGPEQQIVAQSPDGLEFLEDMPLVVLQPEIPDYRSWNYERFRDEMRPWFTEQFPWAVKLEKALNEEYRIEADYLDVLVISRDIWQFRYPIARSEPIPQSYSATIERLATWYDLNPEPLLRIGGREGWNLIAAEPTDGETSMVNLDRWLTELAKVPEPNKFGDLPLYSLEASKYLYRTRAAMYLWIQEHPLESEHLILDDVAGYSRQFASFPPAMDKLQLANFLQEQLQISFDAYRLTQRWLVSTTSDVDCVADIGLLQAELGHQLLKLTPNKPETRK